MHIIVGLGNPDKKYTDTRHNIGFTAVDKIHEHYLFPNFREKFNGLISKGKIHGQDVILVKPMTYMNLSGQCVGEVIRFYKCPIENVVVLHDDLDLPFAKIKTKVAGGNGGHNGLKSITSHIGNNYRRIKIGIDRPKNKAGVANYVLKQFSKDEKNAIKNKLAPNIATYIKLILEEKDSEFMNKLHLF
jgi:PTH1 family peptidyl-tRNA hydrolase